MLVQSKKSPPILQPLRNPEQLPHRRILARINLIHEYAERYRELDISEVRELFDLKYLLEHGTLPPASGRRPTRRRLTLEDLLS